MTDVAIVTGASSGLGREIALLLAEGDRQVVGVARRPFHDPPIASVAGDASRRETAARAVDVAKQLGRITVLVNCAGAGVFGPAGSYDDAAIARVIESNLIATIMFCEALFPRFRTDGGTIVNVLSTAALIGKPNESVYCAAKWGARGYSESLRAEAKGTKARIIAVAPGGMDTPFWSERRSDFMDPKEIAAIVVDAIERPVNVGEIVINR
ncbi:MAG TPA: SDR family oxidoreductase [Thermoanaerobaculia bacterium]|nr:SDR family oxidoreductase [Thermoanaerobaculia bacterium]